MTFAGACPLVPHFKRQCPRRFPARLYKGYSAFVLYKGTIRERFSEKKEGKRKFYTRDSLVFSLRTNVQLCSHSLNVELEIKKKKGHLLGRRMLVNQEHPTCNPCGVVLCVLFPSRNLYVIKG